MSGDWQIGDLALCVGARKSDFPNCRFAGRRATGKIYRVIDVRQVGLVLALELDGLPSPHPLNVWHHASFRKIRPDEQSGEIEDWNLLLETHKQKVSV